MQIILVHGLYMHGLVMHPLSHRLHKLGYRTQTISYNSLAIDDETIFRRLDRAIAHGSYNALVGHSLGGLVIKRYLESRTPSGDTVSHVVAIGSPLQGASIVNKIEQLGLGAALGNSAEFGLKQHHDEWRYPQKLGSIAGTIPLGLRSLLLRDQLDSDGTVTVEETKIAGMTDHIAISTTHTSMLFNHSVAEQIDHFLRYNRFRR
ncbi:triacylglycerol lipase [Vibrio metschnikovii]|nr:triacylglycerol lipase [Vibrio metschnikovii]EKO3889853.1 triacylglycerol lipase [Vibrio metschnikovii]